MIHVKPSGRTTACCCGLEPCGSREYPPLIFSAPARSLRSGRGSLDAKGHCAQQGQTGSGFTAVALPLEYPVTLSEPNALVLDWAEFAVDSGAYEPEEEVLRIDSLLQKALRMGKPRRQAVPALCRQGREAL